MHWNIETMISAFVGFLIAGIALFFVVDGKWGKWLYRCGHWWTHVDSLPENSDYGFISVQNELKRRLTEGAWFATPVSFLIWHYGVENFLSSVLIWLVGIPSTAIGICAATYIRKIFDNSGDEKKTFALPSVEQIKKSVVAVIVSVADTTRAYLSTARQYLSAFGKKVVPVVPVKEVVVEPVEPVGPTEEEKLAAAQAAIDKFTKGR